MNELFNFGKIFLWSENEVEIMDEEENLLSKEKNESWSQSHLGLRQFSIATALIVIRNYFQVL